MKMIGFYDYTVILTYLSLMSGTIGIMLCLNGMGHPYLGMFFLLFSGLCDTFDGKVARSKKDRTTQMKKFGIQIDSLSDLIAFGMLPACIGTVSYTHLDVYKRQVVSITSTIQSSNYYGFGTQESEGAGSGFIVAKTKDNLMIATNNHVVSDATSLTVGFADDTTAKATVVGTDSSADLAVISVKIKDIKDSTASKIKVATLGSSDDLKVGEEVVAIGNALGYGPVSYTHLTSRK